MAVSRGVSGTETHTEPQTRMSFAEGLTLLRQALFSGERADAEEQREQFAPVTSTSLLARVATLQADGTFSPTAGNSR